MSSESMSDNYVKLGLTDGQVLKAEHLDHIEDGISLAFHMASIQASNAIVKVSQALETADSAVEIATIAAESASSAVKTVNGASPDTEGNVNITTLVTIGTVNLLAASWTGSGNLYSQVVSISGVTENSQVDLTPSVEQLVVFYEKDLTLVAENDGGVVTVYAIGQKPENDYTIQVTITEVSV
jgi:hypothetical protein